VRVSGLRPDVFANWFYPKEKKLPLVFIKDGSISIKIGRHLLMLGFFSHPETYRQYLPG
jgi:hypothetical protein